MSQSFPGLCASRPLWWFRDNTIFFKRFCISLVNNSDGDSFSVRSLAIAKQGELTIGTIDDIQKLHIRSIPLGEHARRISHQEQTRTFAICSLKYNQSNSEEAEMHFIRLLDDQTFDFIATYPLDQYEYSCSILNCSFSDDCNVYYCVGTAYVMPEENEPSKVRFSCT